MDNLGKVPLTEWRRKLGKRIEAAYPMLKLSNETAQLYSEELTVLAEEIGRERTEKAVENALRYCHFFPTIAEIRNSIPPSAVRREWRISEEEKQQAIADDDTPEAWVLECLFAIMAGRNRRPNYGFFNGQRKLPPMPAGSIEYLDGLIAKHPEAKIYAQLRAKLGRKETA